MKTPAKVGLVCAGYAVAILAAFAAVEFFGFSARHPGEQGSDGMTAFSDSLLFLGAFGLAAAPPTGAALFFLRPYRPFWLVLSIAALVIAATGLAACLTYIVGRTAEAGSMLSAWSNFAVLRILVAPLFALAFLLSGIFAPSRWARIALLLATAIEAAAFACVAAIWFQLSRA